MSKKCIIKPYIQTITSNPKEQEVLNDLHNQIFDEIKASKQFGYSNGYLMEKDISKGYTKEVNEGRAVVKAVETKYGEGTAWIAKSKAGDRNHVYVSVRPIADKYIDNSGQTKLFQLDTVSKKNDLVDNIKTLEYDYAKANGIKIEFVDSLLEEYSNDPVAVYDSFNKVIKVNTNKATIDTIPEELAHHLSLALGKDHILVKRALNLIGRLDYKAILGPEYVEMYNNNPELLKFELLGKLIAKQLVNSKLPNELNSENGVKIWETIKSLLKAFISLFKPNSNIQSELDSLTSELANMIETSQVVENKEQAIKLFQLDTSKLMDDSIRGPYVYYKGLINQKKRILDSLPKSDSKRAELVAEINSLQAGLNEVLDGNKQALFQMTEETLNEIQEYLDKLYLVVRDGNEPSVDNIEKTVKVLDIFKNIAGLETKATKLQTELLEFAKQSLRKNIERVTGKTTPEDVFKSVNKDIFIGTANFGTLSDITDYLGKSIGLLIKEAQGKVERANKEDYNKLKNHIDKLESYAKNNGMSLQDVYNLFIQEGRGTLILTKPYSEEFYNAIDDSFKQGDKGKTIRKPFARYNEEASEWIPKNSSNYINNNYQTIRSNPELSDFYDFFQKSIAKISDKLPIGRGIKNDFIPNIVQQSILDLLKTDKDTLGKMGDLAKHILDLDSWDEKESKILFDEELEKDNIPLKFLGKLSPDIKSKDLGTALLKFMYFGNSYEYMDEILPKARLLQEFIKNKKYVKNSDPTKAISGEDSNVNKIVEAFINAQILEKNPSEQKYDPYIDFAIKYTSLLRIGLNPFNAFSNIVIGNIGNFIESVGGRYFKTTDYLDALKIYSFDKFIADSKTHKITDMLNPLMELEDYDNLNKISVGNRFTTNKIKSFMYGLQRHGEHQIQVTTMIAVLKTQKVTTKAGEVISMWEAFDENGAWNTELMGYELSEGDKFKLTNKVQRINQMIHGRYSKKDAAALSQYSLFRAAFQFKKWIPAALEARLGAEQFDDRLDSMTRGRYLTIGKLAKQLFGKLKGDIEMLESNKFDEVDLYNMRKNYTEAVLIFAIIMAGIGFKDDKKRKDPLYKFVMRQLNQTSGDILYFWSPGQMTETVATGAPMLKTLQDLYKVVYASPAIFTGKEYTKGRMADENQFTANLLNIIPVVKPIADVARNYKKEPYIEPK